MVLTPPRAFALQVEIINGLPEDATISLYRCGPMVDLCHGPHLPSTGLIKVGTTGCGDCLPGGSRIAPTAGLLLRACLGQHAAAACCNTHVVSHVPPVGTSSAQAVAVTNASRAFWRADVNKEPLQVCAGGRRPGGSAWQVAVVEPLGLHTPGSQLP